MTKYNNFIGKRCLIEMDPLRGIALKENQLSRLNLYNGIIKKIDDTHVFIEDTNQLDYYRESETLFSFIIKKISYLVKYNTNEFSNKENLDREEIEFNIYKKFSPDFVKKYSNIIGQGKKYYCYRLGNLILNKKTVNRIACIDDMLENGGKK